MSVPRDHHFIPAFFLEQWAGPDGKLIEYTIKQHRLIAKPVGPRATGYERDLYAFPELPPETAQHIEQVFWDYADRLASEALKMHLGAIQPKWDSELLSAWSRFVVGMHLRHPDAMPELRAAAQAIWDGSGQAFQRDYEKIKGPNDPATFDELLALRDPLIPVKMRVNLIVKSFDNDVVGPVINNTHWVVVDVSAAPNTLLLSDRPVSIYLLNKPDGHLTVPIGPTKLFLAAKDEATIQNVRTLKPAELVRQNNLFVTQRARRFVWARDQSQERFIAHHMSMGLEPTPFFPNLGR